MLHKMEKEVLECVLKNSWKKGVVSKILNIESCAAVGKYQNFLSTVNRLSLKVELANGRIANRSLIMKVAQNCDEFGRQFQEKYDVFKVETMMYEIVLKEMEYLMEEFEDVDEVLWCNLVHYVPYSCIILEDLKSSGFSMVERTMLFDLDHSLLALNNLGRFHGMSKVLEERGVFDKDGLKPWYACNDLQMHHYWISSTNAMVQGIKNYWEHRWEATVDRIKITVDELHEKLKKLSEVDDKEFNVVGHGDCNKNNIMFKYNWDKKPISMRFVDFQIPFYGSICCDLTYIFYLSIDPFVRRTNFEQLVKTYHESLCRTLERYHFSGRRPSLQEIENGMKKYSFLGLFLFITCYPTIIVSENMDLYFDFDKLLATEGKEGHNLELYKSKNFEKSMGPDIEKLAHNFF